MTIPRYFRFGLLYALVALVADQASKILFVDVWRLGERESIELLPFFKLVMVWNYGISFGMFADESGMRRWLLIGMAAAITLVMLSWLWQARRPMTALAIGLIVGGAIGNVIDRVRWGGVADFFYFHYKDWYWPAFNIADSAIFIGVVLLCRESIVDAKTKTESKDS